MEKLNLSKKNLRKFGITMAVAFLAIMLFVLFRHKVINFYLVILLGVFLITGLFASLILKPVYIFWMKLALLLSWINTRIILFIIFYLILTPIGLAMKLFGADLLEKKIDKSKISYWQMKEKHDFNKADYERQF